MSVEFNKEYELGDFAYFSNEKISAEEVSQEEYISTENMVVDRGGVEKASKLPSVSKFNSFQKTDTLFSNIRTYFRKVWMASFDGGASADVLVFRTKDENALDPAYLYYLISNKDFADYSVLTAKGVKMPRGDKTAMMQYKFLLPDPEKQLQYASALKSLDDKIENNRRMNETLEGMAQAIFKSWFVDFDPVHAKANGSNVPDDIVEHFPDSFDDDIPTGWEMHPVLSSAKYINGAAYKNMHFSKEPDTKPVIKIAELKNGITDQTKWTNTELGEKYKLDTGDILFSWSGSPDTSIDTFIWTGGPAWLNQHIFKVVNDSPQDRCFTFWLLKHLKSQFIEIARDKQTTGLGHVTRKDMDWMQYCRPKPDAIKLFYQKVGPILELIQNNLIENQSLAETRDALLPKLLSGEIDVSNIDSEGA